MHECVDDADIQAALDYVEANPTVTQYSTVAGVLEDYLASLQSPGAANAGEELKFTGGELYMGLAAGPGRLRLTDARGESAGAEAAALHAPGQERHLPAHDGRPAALGHV